MRFTKELKAKYKFIGEAGQCYFCPSQSTLNDATPSHRADAADREAFNGEHVRTEVCAPCWSKIHKANWIDGGRRFGVPRGCMTIAHKLDLCSGVKIPVNRGTYVVAFDGQFVIHSEMVRDAEDSDVFYHGGNRWDIMELQTMQPLFAMRFTGLHTDAIKNCFWNIVVPGDDVSGMNLDKSNLQKYQKALGIDDVSAE